MSTVLERIPKAVEEHTNYISSHKYESETGFQYTSWSPRDRNKELTLTILVFGVLDTLDSDKKTTTH